MAKMKMIVDLVDDVAARMRKREKDRAFYETWLNREPRDWSECPSIEPLEPIKNEIKLIRRLLNEIELT